MRKLAFSILLAAAFTGCGSSSGGVGVPTADFDFDNAQGNFITTTVEAERRFLYTANLDDNNLGAFVIPDAEEGGHGHDHAHERSILAQDDHDHEEDDHGHGEEGEEGEELEFEPLDGSPYLPGGTQLVDVAAGPLGLYLYTLDSSGQVDTYRIDGVRGFLYPESTAQSSVTDPRRLVFSSTGDALAVLGDQLSIHEIDNEGVLSAGSVHPGTGDWTDVGLNARNGVGATPNGVVGFQWAPGIAPSVRSNIALPGATRGELALAEEFIYVVNRADATVSRLTQEGNGELTLVATLDLPGGLTDPMQIITVFDGEDLMVADSDSANLLHPEETELEDEGEVELDRAPNRLFELHELATVLVGHDTGTGTTIIEIGEEGLEAHEEEGPGGAGVFGFGFAERVELVTETTGFE